MDLKTENGIIQTGNGTIATLSSIMNFQFRWQVLAFKMDSHNGIVVQRTNLPRHRLRNQGTNSPTRNTLNFCVPCPHLLLCINFCAVPPLP